MPVPTRRALVAGAWVVALATIALIVYLLIMVVHLTDSDATSVADRSALRSQLSSQEAKTEALATQLKDLGETPVVEPGDPIQPQIRYVPIPGKDGAPGRRGLPGLPGNDGASVTGKPGESITGSPGATGPAGKDGADGKNGVDGAPGKDGTNGTNGSDGRGITSLSCVGIFAPITFTVTYTDGTTAEFSCGTTPDPVPTD